MYTHIVKMVTFGHNLLQYILKIWLSVYITWVCQSKTVKHCRTYEKNITEYETPFKPNILWMIYYEVVLVENGHKNEN